MSKIKKTIQSSRNINEPIINEPSTIKCTKCDKFLMRWYYFIWKTGNEDTYYVQCANGKCGHKNEFHYKKGI